jgi:hypothetical protein
MTMFDMAVRVLAAQRGLLDDKSVHCDELKKIPVNDAGTPFRALTRGVWFVV